jgi:hypothetical protein
MPEIEGRQVQQGFLYEMNAYKALKPYGITGRPPAGASHDRPDLELKSGKSKPVGVELKNAPTTAGSLVMQYYDGEWHFGPTGGDIEKEFMKSIGVKAGILDRMNKEWKKPVLQYKNGQKVYIGAEDSRAAYALDIAKFGGKGGDLYEDVRNKDISNYYNKKATYYMNVGTHGFFLLNNSDPLDLQEKLKKAKQKLIPDFSQPSSAQTKIRVRTHYKGGGSYQFSFTLQFGRVIKSPYNIAPIRLGSSALIDTQKLKRDAILGIF